MIDLHDRFVWYELATTERAAAKAFYTGVMGWDARDISTPVPYTIFTNGETPVCGLMDLPETARKKGAKPRWLGYVGVEDVDATVDRIKDLGGAVLVPPTDMLSLSRFAVVADPQMANFALVTWPKASEKPQTELEARGRVGWHELLAGDREKALAFYSELFGWQRAEAKGGAMGRYQLISIGEQTIGGVVTKPRTVSVPSWVYYFNVGDIDSAAKSVNDRGGKISRGSD